MNIILQVGYAAWWTDTKRRPELHMTMTGCRLAGMLRHACGLACLQQPQWYLRQIELLEREWAIYACDNSRSFGEPSELVGECPALT